MLVARAGASGDGYLEIDVQRRPGATTPGAVERARRGRGRELLPGDRPRLARWFYTNTQSRIHVLVTHGFLRSLARLDLAESAVGRFAADACDGRCPIPREPLPPSTARGSARAARSAVAAAPVIVAQLRAVVPAWMRRTVPERERMTSDSVGRRAALVAHALQHVAVGHAGGGEEAVVALDEVVVRELRSRS